VKGEKNMKIKKYSVVLFALFALLSLACGLLDTVVNNAVDNNDHFTRTTSLWSDVPQMDGLKPSELDSMPPFIKLALRVILGNLGKLNPQGQDQTTGNIDWVVFATDKTPDDVSSFYTNQRMVASGWDDAGQNSTCVSGSESGYSQIGVFCVFVKQKENTQLVLVAAQDEQSGQTNVFFLRLQTFVTPTP
jgi:hypothetical protein